MPGRTRPRGLATDHKDKPPRRLQIGITRQIDKLLLVRAQAIRDWRRHIVRHENDRLIVCQRLRLCLRQNRA